MSSAEIAPIKLVHQFEEDARATITVHLDPNDEPIVNQPATILVEVDGEECGCHLLVTQSGTTIADLALDHNKTSTTVQNLKQGPLAVTVTAADETFTFDYYVQSARNETLQSALAIGATILVTGMLVGILTWVGRKKNRATGASRTPDNVKLSPASLTLVILGLVLIGLGAFYVFGAHSVLEQIPGLADLPHNAHIYIGGGGAVLGLVSVLAGELLRRKNVGRSN